MRKVDPGTEKHGPGGEGPGGGPGGTTIFGVIDGLPWFVNPPGWVTGRIVGNAAYSHRKLTGGEWDMARTVFGSSLPSRDLIFLTTLSGLDDRPFTLPGSLIVSLTAALPVFPLELNLLRVAIASLANTIGMGSLSFGYLLNMGGHYAVASQDDRATLIHELTHVWQGAHGGYQWKYVFESIVAQIGSGRGAYAYVPGQPWGDYNPEQQAHLVEDWFNAGASDGDPLFPYIRDHIRKGKA